MFVVWAAKTTRGLFVVDGDDPVDRVVERYKSLCADDSGYHLYLVVEQIHQMLVVAGIEFDEHRVRAGREMTFDNLRYFVKLSHDVAVHGAALEIDAYIGACGIA